uniref:Uncharacterized protein n=1 Tax=Setaria italica TaxID=4555 RepID=K4ANA9_SETIT
MRMLLSNQTCSTNTASYFLSLPLPFDASMMKW